MNCEIVNVGTELLLGDILNTNAQFLSRELANMGIDVQFITTVGDNAGRLTQVLQNALNNNDMVITTAGLGPTADDVTKEVLCKALGVELYLDEESYQNIQNYFKRFGHEMPLTNKKQAMMPVNGTILKNNHGTAPGCAIEKNNKCVIMLPGPPRELIPMFNESVKPFLQKYAGGIIESRNIRLFGIGESAMAEKVADLLDKSNPTVAPYAKTGEALLRVTAKADSKEEAENLLKPVVDDICGRFGMLVYGIDKDSIEQRVVELLKEKNKKVAVAESCTGGYIAKRLTDISGASEVFECGIVSYSNAVKNKILNVSQDTLDNYTAISQQVSAEMAKGVLPLSGADIGIGITGLAGPLTDDSQKPVGLNYITLTDGKDFWCRELCLSGRNDRDLNRYIAASTAFNMIRLYLEGLIDKAEGITKNPH